MNPSDPRRPDHHDHDHGSAPSEGAGFFLAPDPSDRFVSMLTEAFGPDEDPLASGDCGAVLERLYLFLDGELTEERRALIQQHLDRCTTCGEVFDFEAELRMVVRDKVQTHVPETLKLRITQSLRMASGDGGTNFPSDRSGNSE